MSAKNPYDDYDALEPTSLEDGDDSGDFSFVEDEYDSVDQGVEEGFAYPNESHGRPAMRKGSTKELPRTQVRPAIGFSEPQPRIATHIPSNQILRRRRKSQRHRGNEYEYASDPYARAPEPVPAPPPEPYDVQDAYETRHPRRLRRPRRHRHHFGCLFTILCLVAVVVGAYWVVAHPIDDLLAFTPDEQQTVNGTLSWNVPGMPYYVLALGSDAREGEDSSRTDTMLLVRVDLVGGKLTLISIPRDTMVEIDGHGRSKINAAYAYGGVGGAVRAVTKLTGVPINHVAVIHFEQLVGLVDFLGGVTVNVPVDIYDPDYSGLVLSAGMQTMDGTTALAFARTRYGFENGDYQRQEDQRILLTAIMNRILSLSPGQIPEALRQLGAMVGTDMRCYNLVPLLLRLKLASPTVYSCAVPTTSDMLDGYWYEVVNQTALQELLRVVNAGGDPDTISR